VIFTPETGWTLLLCLTRPLAGHNVAQQRSYMEGKLGEQIASPGVNVRDNALLPQGASRRAFDGEGTPSRDLRLVKDGQLMTYLTDLASAAKLGIEPGGNAVRGSYDAKPQIRSSNLYLEAGNMSPAEIVRQTDRGLLLSYLSGWWVGMSPVTDTFSAAAMGFWIEKGERVHPVRGVTIGGSLQEMLKSIDWIGNDLRHLAPTTTPTFRITEMAISGA
jgi:PmbA protein